MLLKDGSYHTASAKSGRSNQQFSQRSNVRFREKRTFRFTPYSCLNPSESAARKLPGSLSGSVFEMGENQETA